MTGLVEARATIARLQGEVQQCHAKSSCMCGAEMKNHSAYDGHTPVSMYDYSLECVEAEVAKLRKAGLRALEQWKMYAEMDESIDLASHRSPEAELYRAIKETFRGNEK